MTPKEARAIIETAFKAEWGTDIPVDYNNDMALMDLGAKALRIAGVQRAIIR